jgi:hypothetical protein
MMLMLAFGILQAVLINLLTLFQELNSHLKIKAEKLHLKARDQRKPEDDEESIPGPVSIPEFRVRYKLISSKKLASFACSFNFVSLN